MTHPPKYPSTPHWPWSESVHKDDSYHADPEFFLGREVVITEKLDGGNTCLWNGETFARSVQAPASDGWFAMVKKHHAWKTATRDDICLYGEDLYGIHSLEYDPMRENETFRLFAVRYFNPKAIEEDNNNGWFADWDLIETHAKALDLKTVPVLFRGKFNTLDEITAFFKENLKTPSSIGSEKEGFVIRIADTFDARDFQRCVAKFVREGHVQTDEHWRRNWQPCKLLKEG